jgi:pimeloyl-ACP methyl ester carboxylesterase
MKILLKQNVKYIILILILQLLVSCHPKSQESFQPRFIPSDTTTHAINKNQKFTFGYLEVLENRQNESSDTIQMPVYIFKSRSKNPKKDPIIYTVGGPGYSTMRSAQYMNAYQYLDDRDFILIEQRGTQYAKPHLACPEWAKAVYESNLPNFDTANTKAHFEKAARSCRDRLSLAGIDLNRYNTNEIAADINDLVEVLDIEQYNLLTISYSTKIAQVLMRDYPKRIRSVVMDSPLPLEVSYDEESVQNLLESVSQLLSDCENDANCKAAFPDLKNRFFTFLRDITESPLEVSVKNPKTNSFEMFRLQGKDLITLLGSFSTQSAPYIPLEIHKVLNNDLSSVEQQLATLFEGPSSGNGVGMRLSVWCSEEAPFNSWKTVQEETQKYPEVRGLSPTVFDRSVCTIWGVEPVDKRENVAVQSVIPTLLISGTYDSQTPMKWALAMQENLSNSYHLAFNGWAHIPTTNWSNSCAMEAANQFFNNPSEKPQTKCHEELKQPIFKTK